MTTENKQPDERAALDDAIARAKRILEAVDTYHARPDGGNRHALRSMLLDEFQELLGARATTEQANKGDQRAAVKRKTSNPNRGGTEAYLATEHFNEGWNACLDAAPQAVALADADIKRIALEYCAEDGAIPSYEWIRFARALLAAHPTEQRMSDTEHFCNYEHGGTFCRVCDAGRFTERRMSDAERDPESMALRALAATDAYRVAMIHELQKALAYWMPKVFDDRSADDAYLLVGYEGEDETSCWGDQMVAALPRWMPVDESLPTEPGWYLAILKPDNDWGLMSDTALQVEFDAYTSKPKAFTCFYDHHGDEDITEAVTHWMRMPSIDAARKGDSQ